MNATAWSPADATKAWTDAMAKMASWPSVVETAQRVRVGATPTEACWQIDRVKLLRYLGEPQETKKTPLVVVFALVNRPYILDLKRGKSVVAHFLDAGFDVYNIDWGVPSQADRVLGLEDYVERYIGGVVDHLRERSGCAKVNMLGYCMGGSLSAMYTALHPDKIKNLMLMAAPVDWSSRDHLLSKWLDPEYFDVDKLIDVCGNAPAEMLQGAFSLLKPVSNLVNKYVSFYENVDNQKYLEDFFAMETWLNDNIPVAGEVFRSFVKDCMQKNKLIKGELQVGKERVDLANINCPVLNIVAEQDHLVPCGQSLPLKDAVGAAEYEAIKFPAGHIGLAVGSKANRDMWPMAAEWLAARSD